ncbi:MAG: isochorismatase family protein [Planctomycetes bacterium]|nr:isochorismatase family protein [Planctomycetota bacterium]MBI3835205.1 isochorismatase family protein [Planctomycetota bacterium]
MSARKNGRGYESVLLDVNTQRDFCAPDGSCPVVNIAELVRGLRITVAWARRNHVPVVSSVESHRPFELSDSGTPIYCVDGSNGQHKLGFTLFPLRTKVEVDNTLSLPIDLFDNHQQVIFRKRTDDLLLNPKADRLLSQLPTDEFTLCGTGLETSIKAAALALLARGKRVCIIVDACGYWNRSAADLALRQIVAKGALLITVDHLRERRCGHHGVYPFMHRNGAKPREMNDHSLNGNGKAAFPANSNDKANIKSNGKSNGQAPHA